MVAKHETEGPASSWLLGGRPGWLSAGERSLGVEEAGGVAEGSIKALD